VLVINKDFQLTIKNKKGPRWSVVNEGLINEIKNCVFGDKHLT